MDITIGRGEESELVDKNPNSDLNKLRKHKADHFLLVETPLADISSTEVRNRLLKGNLNYSICKN